MKNIIKYLDIILAPIILISLFYVELNDIFWISYALACFAYIYVNWKKALFGQATINIIAGLIAIKNFIN